MKGLNHEFLLVNRDEYDYWDYMNLINHSDSVLIRDDLMDYLADSLKWIPCYNPGHGKKKGLLSHNGLNFCGPTIVKGDGVLVFHRVFTAWEVLFSHGPPTLELTGSFGWIMDKPAENGTYSAIVVDRDDTVKNLRRIAELGDRVDKNSDHLYILHLGV